MKTFKVIIGITILASLLLAGCNTQTTPVTILKISGGKAEVNLTANDIKGKSQVEVEYTGKDGTVTKYTGTALKQLLPEVAEANTLTFVGKDGYTVDLSGADLLKCGTCIVAFQDDGGLRTVMPGQSGKLQVKDLVEIKIKQ
jgi:hypothetical protein